MAAHQQAHRAASRPLREFSIHLRSATEHLNYTAMAASSGDALCAALAEPGLAPPVAASVCPVRYSTIQ